ncbi:hypothetical protein A0H76_499 [Hepatospora eriocheir]|uniref:Uncharacterized protein n=1 Tax=Hepatospora eriocheir TaxID=1081669 RepID=A0A1X0Q925_9MICR|nr:hypothetical protein A0H76_499 [Hepatospora eriocheir]
MNIVVDLIKEYYKIIIVVFVLTGIVITGILLNNLFDKRNIESKEKKILNENVDVESEEIGVLNPQIDVKNEEKDVIIKETKFEFNDNSDYKLFLELLNIYCEEMIAKLTDLKNNWFNFNKNEEEKIFKDKSYIKSKTNEDNFVKNLSNFTTELKENRKKFDNGMHIFKLIVDSKTRDKINEELKKADQNILFYIILFEKKYFISSVKLRALFINENYLFKKVY